MVNKHPSLRCLFIIKNGLVKGTPFIYDELMNTLESLQQHANKSQLVDKTRLTTYTSKKHKTTEQRLWIYFTGSKNPMLMKKYWLSGDDSRDLARSFSEYMRI